jgi:thiamine pyrophosphate-dependent acetolactate synthase large subunit-like protein
VAPDDRQEDRRERRDDRPQVESDDALAGYYRLLRDIAAWMPKNSVLSAEGAGTMDIGLTMLPSFNARSYLNAGIYGTMGVGLGITVTVYSSSTATRHPRS